MLRDLIDSGKVPQVRLTEIFRQAQQSLIVTNAHAIVRGEMPQLKRHDNDFFFLKRESAAQIRSTVIDLVSTRLPKSYGYSPMTDIQVIVPTRVGAVGTNALNQSLQQVLNPPDKNKPEFELNGRKFRVGDKVMQIKNNYDILFKRDNGEEGMGVYNGDIGFIRAINRASREITVLFDDGREAVYTEGDCEALEHAYCISVHKSQGSEFEAVVLPLVSGPPMLMNRNLLYTAVTRARRIVVIVGREAAIWQMVANKRDQTRYSGLARRLSEGNLQ